MFNQDYTAKLLNLEDVIITNVENIAYPFKSPLYRVNWVHEARSP